MNVTVRETVTVNAPIDRVWEYTQDWSRRAEWDPAVLSAAPHATHRAEAPVYEVRGAGGLAFVARYKQYERPRKTSLEMTDLSSRLVSGGGGSWSYEADGAGTRWTQTNTIVLRDGVTSWLFKPIVKWQLARLTRKAMNTARARLER